MAARVTNRRFAFALAVVSVLAAKAVHIHTHVTALSRVHLLRWGYSFFAQDMFLLVFIRLLVDSWVFAAVRPVRILATFAASVLLAFVIALGAVHVSFFIVSGSEIHWRNIALAGDASSWSMFMSGTFSFMLVAFGGLAASFLLQDLVFALFGFGSNLVKWPVAAILRRIPLINRLALHKVAYGQILQHESEHVHKAVDYYSDEESLFSNSAEKSETAPRYSLRQWIKPLTYLFIGCALAGQVICFFIRPHESSLVFMSWTSALLPFVDFADSSPLLKHLAPVYDSGIGYTWDNMTAVHNVSSPAEIPWALAQNMDFWQHYVSQRQYSAADDPLRISNAKENILASLGNTLADVPIRHVVVLILESTRKDVFPMRKDGLIRRKLMETYEDQKLPDEVEEKLRLLTPNANYITGDYNDSFPDAEGRARTSKRRGGINFNNAYTSSTYTLKSMVGTLCGSPPLIADWNLEYVHELPTPCLPHVFDAMNHIDVSHDGIKGEAAKHGGFDFASDKWQSLFMQSATMEFDHQKVLMENMGYLDGNMLTKEYLQGKQDQAPSHGVADLPEVNYFSIPETPLEDYLRDAFMLAKERQERVFLTHLTSTSHHPFGLPEEETYVAMANDGAMEDLSKYLNTIGFEDKWLGKVLAVLDDQGVANETLVVMVGDHGLSMPENDLNTAYYNPNVGNLHVPLVLSHPKLPVLHVDDAVTSLSILPTLLDLLIETGSLAPPHVSLAKSLMANNYEGQSLIRNLLKTSPTTGQGHWQFTVINPGRSMISIRDARQPHLHLVVPVVDNSEWSFVNLELDPEEKAPLQAFDFRAFMLKVEGAHGVEIAKWAEEGAFIARWWVEENGKRWHYGAYEDD
ncbi:hypothetical protein E4U23_007665 [Claviceps purpurea]|nr:hypothetical protein E4U23_007665 [Claviceps purpurea]